MTYVQATTISSSASNKKPPKSVKGGERISSYTLVLYTCLLGVLCLLNVSLWAHFYFVGQPWHDAPMLRSGTSADSVTAAPPAASEFTELSKMVRNNITKSSGSTTTKVNTIMSTFLGRTTMPRTAFSSIVPHGSSYLRSNQAPLDILLNMNPSKSENQNFSAPVSSKLFLSSGSGSSREFTEMRTFSQLSEHNAKHGFKSRNAILGLASLIDARYLAVFVKSARRVDKNVEIIVFLDKASLTQTRINSVLLDADVHVIEYDTQLLQPSFLRNYHPSSNRWIFYHRFFSAYGGFFGNLFDRVVLSDVRDVHFSSNPFSHLSLESLPQQRPDQLESMEIVAQHLKFTRDVFLNPDDATLVQRNQSWFDVRTQKQLSESLTEVHLSEKEIAAAGNLTHQRVFAFVEEDAPQIGGCVWNAGWIKDCFGQAVLDVISQNPISCSGVVLGIMPDLLVYLKTFATILLGRSNLSDKFPLCERNGVDQGVHNVLLHTGKIPALRLHSARTFHGVMSHMQSDIYVSVDGSKPPQVINAVGDVVSIVHQYDRISTLQLQYAEYFVDWMDVHDPNQGWKNSLTCTHYHPLVQADLLKGTCDFGSLRALQPDMCCDACERKKGCTSFTFTEGVCWFKRCDIQQLRDIYLNYTMHVALDLSMLKYTAVLDAESMQPVTSLVLTGIPSAAVELTTSDARHETLIKALLMTSGRSPDQPIKIGKHALETTSVTQMAKDYRLFLKELEAENAAATW